jgi:hypothetical protein
MAGLTSMLQDLTVLAESGTAAIPVHLSRIRIWQKDTYPRVKFARAHKLQEIDP